MLVLSRKPGEAVIIGDGEIRITILEIDRGKVRISFQAARSIPINREELWLEKTGRSSKFLDPQEVQEGAPTDPPADSGQPDEQAKHSGSD